MNTRATRFEDLIVWQRARTLAVEIYRVSGVEPFARDFGLQDQIRRAGVSVMSNIAEGFGRYGPAEFSRFLRIALGSNAEVRSQLYLALDLGYLDEEVHAALARRCAEIDRLLCSLRSSIIRRVRGPNPQ